jgi:hypothetical protein
VRSTSISSRQDALLTLLLRGRMPVGLASSLAHELGLNKTPVSRQGGPSHAAQYRTSSDLETLKDRYARRRDRLRMILHIYTSQLAIRTGWDCPKSSTLPSIGVDTPLILPIDSTTTDISWGRALTASAKLSKIAELSSEVLF